MMDDVTERINESINKEMNNGLTSVEYQEVSSRGTSYVLKQTRPNLIQVSI